MRKRFINLGTGFSSADDKEVAVFKSHVDLTDFSDTCDEKTRYRFDLNKAMADMQSTVSMSIVGTDLAKY